MCLLRRDDQDTNCGHEECRNYYMLNKQICMYNGNQPNANQNAGQQPQIQTPQTLKNTILMHPQQNSSTGIESVNTKRSSG